MPKRESHRLPDGTTTKSATKYVKKWKKLARAVRLATNGRYTLYGFDPNLSFKVKGSHKTAEISVDIALLLQELVFLREENKQMCSDLVKAKQEKRKIENLIFERNNFS